MHCPPVHNSRSLIKILLLRFKCENASNQLLKEHPVKPSILPTVPLTILTFRPMKSIQCFLF